MSSCLGQILKLLREYNVAPELPLFWPEPEPLFGSIMQNGSIEANVSKPTPQQSCPYWKRLSKMKQEPEVNMDLSVPVGVCVKWWLSSDVVFYSSSLESVTQTRLT